MSQSQSSIGKFGDRLRERPVLQGFRGVRPQIFFGRVNSSVFLFLGFLFMGTSIQVPAYIIPKFPLPAYPRGAAFPPRNFQSSAKIRLCREPEGTGPARPLPVIRSPSYATGEAAMDPMADSYGGISNLPLGVNRKNP